MRFLKRAHSDYRLYRLGTCGSMVAALLPWLPHVLNGGDRVSVHTVLCAGRSGGRATCRLCDFIGCLRFSSRGVAMGVVDTPAPVDWKIFLFLSNFFVGDYWYVGWAVVLIGAILVTIRLSPK